MNQEKQDSQRLPRVGNGLYVLLVGTETFRPINMFGGKAYFSGVTMDLRSSYLSYSPSQSLLLLSLPPAVQLAA